MVEIARIYINKPGLEIVAEIIKGIFLYYGPEYGLNILEGLDTYGSYISINIIDKNE
jgi:hypothetical protein